MCRHVPVTSSRIMKTVVLSDVASLGKMVCKEATQLLAPSASAIPTWRVADEWQNWRKYRHQVRFPLSWQVCRAFHWSFQVSNRGRSTLCWPEMDRDGQCAAAQQGQGLLQTLDEQKFAG